MPSPHHRQFREFVLQTFPEHFHEYAQDERLQKAFFSGMGVAHAEAPTAPPELTTELVTALALCTTELEHCVQQLKTLGFPQGDSITKALLQAKAQLRSHKQGYSIAAFDLHCPMPLYSPELQTFDAHLLAHFTGQDKQLIFPLLHSIIPVLAGLKCVISIPRHTGAPDQVWLKISGGADRIAANAVLEHLVTTILSAAPLNTYHRDQLRIRFGLSTS